jgi:hypothetical protein
MFLYLLTLVSFQNSTAPRESLVLLSFEQEANKNRIVVRYVVERLNLQGIFSSNSLSQLVELRVVNLSNNSLFGLIPSLRVDLSYPFIQQSHWFTSGRVTSAQKLHLSQTELKPFYLPPTTFESNPI